MKLRHWQIEFLLKTRKKFLTKKGGKVFYNNNKLLFHFNLYSLFFLPPAVSTFLACKMKMTKTLQSNIIFIMYSQELMAPAEKQEEKVIPMKKSCN